MGLAELLASIGDPEAQGSAEASQAMSPAVISHLAGMLADAQGRAGLGYDPRQSLAQNALNPAGLEQAQSIAMSSGPGAIRAYHGSPHDFDAFDSSKIGTGEGAQAYGHGLYFAENPEVADLYSRVVTKGQPGWAGSTPPAFDSIVPAELAKIPEELRGQLAASWQNNGEDVARNLARKMFEESRGATYSNALHALANQVEWKPPGHRYEVNLHADPEAFLNYDKPLSEQPGIQSVFDRLGMTAGPRWELLPKSNLMSGASRLSPQESSAALSQAGVPGIKYLDQGSRGAGDGTSNYVVFDPKIIEIVKKYGLAGLLASGMAADPGT
jgi:hypothetical protein